MAAPSGSVFLKGNAEALGVTVGEGDPELQRPPPGVATEGPPPGVGGLWADSSLPPPSEEERGGKMEARGG